MDDKGLKIDVGIVTYNRKEYLKTTLHAIVNMHTPFVNSIFVFDNNSTDGTDSFLKENFSNITYFKNKKNVGSAGGFAACMNYLLTSDADWIWLFNDDSYPNNLSIDFLNDALNNFDLTNVGMIKISREIEGKAEIIYWNGIGKGKLIPISNEFKESDLVTFDGTLISKKLIQSIGTCNPNFFMGTYEYDFCLRATDKKFKILTLPNGTIIDLKLGSTGGVPIWRTYFNTRNHLYLVLQRKSIKGIFQWVFRELKYSIGILMFKDKKIRRIQMKIMATYHGVIGRLGKVIDINDSRWN